MLPHVSMPQAMSLDFVDVEERGRLIIESARARLAELLRKALTQEVYWHPTGFIVIPLQDIEGLGLLRLHIWPRALRRKRPRNPEVHAHCFHLQSFVVAGTYVEHQYEATAVSTDVSALRGFSVVPPTGDGVDRLRPDQRQYSLRTIRTETTAAGGFHSLPAGVHHMTDIPREGACATLALLSRPQPGMVDHLIGREADTAVSSERAPVAIHELDEALAQVGLS